MTNNFALRAKVKKKLSELTEQWEPILASVSDNKNPYNQIFALEDGSIAIHLSRWSLPIKSIHLSRSLDCLTTSQLMSIDRLLYGYDVLVKMENDLTPQQKLDLWNQATGDDLESLEDDHA